MAAADRWLTGDGKRGLWNYNFTWKRSGEGETFPAQSRGRRDKRYQRRSPPLLKRFSRAFCWRTGRRALADSTALGALALASAEGLSGHSCRLWRRSKLKGSPKKTREGSKAIKSGQASIFNTGSPHGFVLSPLPLGFIPLDDQEHHNHSCSLRLH